MDPDLLAWLAAFESPDESDAALLSTLLSDSTDHGGDACEHQLPTVDETSLATVAECATAATSDEGGTTGKPLARVKAKRRNAWRAKHEIERLRASVADLESVLSLHTQRRSGQRAPAGRASAPSDRGHEMWRGVASRQLRQLRDSLGENQQLRAQLQNQVAMSHSLARLVRRALGTVSPQLIPRHITPIDEAVFGYKRQELVAAVGAMFDSLGGVSVDAFSYQPSEEFRTMRTLTMANDHNIQPGTLLAMSQARRFVPAERSKLADRIWGYFHSSPLSVQHVERSPELQIVLFGSFEVPTVNGPAVLRSMGAQGRFRTGSRDVYVAVGSIWPDVSAPSEVHSEGLDIRSWTITQPHSASEDFSEVLFQVQCFSNRSPGVKPREPVAVLPIAAATNSYMVDANDRLLDGLLLSS